MDPVVALLTTLSCVVATAVGSYLPLAVVPTFASAAGSGSAAGLANGALLATPRVSGPIGYAEHWRTGSSCYPSWCQPATSADSPAATASPAQPGTGTADSGARGLLGFVEPVSEAILVPDPTDSVEMDAAPHPIRIKTAASSRAQPRIPRGPSTTR